MFVGENTVKRSIFSSLFPPFVLWNGIRSNIHQHQTLANYRSKREQYLLIIYIHKYRRPKIGKAGLHLSNVLIWLIPGFDPFSR